MAETEKPAKPFNLMQGWVPWTLVLTVAVFVGSTSWKASAAMTSVDKSLQDLNDRFQQLDERLKASESRWASEIAKTTADWRLESSRHERKIALLEVYIHELREWLAAKGMSAPRYREQE
jgi:hypothetical protein